MNTAEKRKITSLRAPPANTGAHVTSKENEVPSLPVTVKRISLIAVPASMDVRTFEFNFS